MSKRAHSLLSSVSDTSISQNKVFQSLLEIHNNSPKEISSDEGSIHLLDPSITKTLHESGIFDLFPVQNLTIPVVLNEVHAEDACISAPTGSGKTLAYVLPILNLVKDSLCRRLQCIVVVPTKDLVMQVESVLKKYSSELSVTFLACAGGNRSIEEEQELFLTTNSAGNVSSKVDILVCTPMRLLDHLESAPKLIFDCVRLLVFDEADRLFDTDASTEWYFSLLNAVNAEQRCNQSFPSAEFVCPLKKIFFSATLSRNPAKLAGLKLKSPKIINISSEKYPIPETLQEYYSIVSEENKLAALLYFIDQKDLKKILCFTNSNEGTEKLAYLSTSCCNYSVGFFTGQKSMYERKSILKDFQSGSIRLLICSDGISRGMDFENVDCVVNFEPPNFIKTYMHRIGRTARAMKEGCSFSIITKKESKIFLDMLQKASRIQPPVLFNIKEDAGFASFSEKISNVTKINTISKSEFELKAYLKSKF